VFVLVVLALLGGGGAAYVVATLPPPTYPVPDLSGDTLSAAAPALAPHHFRLVVVDRVWDASVARGVIISQQPLGGRRLKARQTVVVTLSRGPQPVAVPALATLDLDQARSALGAAGLTLGHVTHRTSMTVPDGVVISWSDAGHHLLPGSVVNLVVSSGKPMALIPAIGTATATYPLMAATLAKAGFVAHEATTYSNTVPDGYVISTYPASGDREVVGTQVTVTVSMGPHMVTVPAGIIGESVGQAIQTLENAGLYNNGVQGDALNAVTGSNPAVGTSVHYGSSIVLITG
jgi:serine/threonine-protein kinase